MTPDSGPTAGRPGLGFKLRSSDFLGLPCVAYAQGKRVGLRSALLFCCAVFSCVMSIPNTRTRAASSSAGSGGWWKQGSRLAFHSHAPAPRLRPPWARHPCGADVLAPLCRRDPRDPEVQPPSRSCSCVSSLPGSCTTRAAVDGACAKRRCPLDPSFPAGSPCPSGCGSRPAG